jgi:hypothetical protein
MLRSDRVLFQEGNMRFKRNCRELQEKDRVYKLNFEKTKPRLDALQEELFSGRPFDLARNEKLD